MNLWSFMGWLFEFRTILVSTYLILGNLCKLITGCIWTFGLDPEFNYSVICFFNVNELTALKLDAFLHQFENIGWEKKLLKLQKYMGVGICVEPYSLCLEVPPYLSVKYYITGMFLNTTS